MTDIVRRLRHGWPEDEILSKDMPRVRADAMEAAGEIERLRERQEDRLDDNHWNTLQEMLNALNDLPGVFERVEAFMIGRGIESPKVEIEALHKIAF